MIRYLVYRWAAYLILAGAFSFSIRWAYQNTPITPEYAAAALSGVVIYIAIGRVFEKPRSRAEELESKYIQE